MSALALPSGSGRPPRVMHAYGFFRLPDAAYELYETLWLLTGFGSRPRTVTDRELAEATGRSLRWVQKALHQLETRMKDGVVLPIIRRFRVYGRKQDAGRAIEIVDADSLPDRREPAEASAPHPRPRSTAAPRAAAPSIIPNVGVVKGASPEQIAVAAARAVEDRPPPEPTPEDQAILDDFLAASRKRREAAAQAAARAANPPHRRTPEELRAQIERRRAEVPPAIPTDRPAAGGPAGQPSGP